MDVDHHARAGAGSFEHPEPLSGVAAHVVGDVDLRHPHLARHAEDLLGPGPSAGDESTTQVPE